MKIKIGMIIMTIQNLNQADFIILNLIINLKIIIKNKVKINLVAKKISEKTLIKIQKMKKKII